jgi:hypothetical protein
VVSSACLTYLSAAFATKKKKGTTAEWNEEFESDVDRDDLISFKIWDMGKIERNVDVSRRLEPASKKKMNVKEFAREGPIVKELQELDMIGGGKLFVEISLTIKIPVPGEVHTKTFSYPSWMTDRYGVNQIPPDLDSIRTGWTTLARYTSRWLLSQRAIQASLNNDEDEDEAPVSPRDGEPQDIPEGLQFTLVDISACAHDKAHQLVITYTWKQKDPEKAEDDLFVRPKILTSKLFSIETTLHKKKLYDGKGQGQGTYQDAFEKITKLTDEIVTRGTFPRLERAPIHREN